MNSLFLLVNLLLCIDKISCLCCAFKQVEIFLSRVEQSPPKSTHTALSPSMKALVADELLRHSDVDVKVAVASCISEITRITAPDAPYDDDRMKVPGIINFDFFTYSLLHIPFCNFPFCGYRISSS